MKRLTFLVVLISLAAIPRSPRLHQPRRRRRHRLRRDRPAHTDTQDRVRHDRRYLSQSAEKMPEADFAFKPTPEVRSFGDPRHVATRTTISARGSRGKEPERGGLREGRAKADMVKG